MLACVGHLYSDECHAKINGVFRWCMHAEPSSVARILRVIISMHISMHWHTAVLWSVARTVWRKFTRDNTVHRPCTFCTVFRRFFFKKRWLGFSPWHSRLYLNGRWLIVSAPFLSITLKLLRTNGRQEQPWIGTDPDNPGEQSCDYSEQENWLAQDEWPRWSLTGPNKWATLSAGSLQGLALCGHFHLLMEMKTRYTFPSSSRQRQSFA